MCHFLIHNMENDLKVSNTKQSNVANHSPWKLKSFLENSVRNFLCGKRGHYSFPKLCSGMIALASRQEWSAGSTLRLKHWKNQILYGSHSQPLFTFVGGWRSARYCKPALPHLAQSFFLVSSQWYTIQHLLSEKCWTRETLLCLVEYLFKFCWREWGTKKCCYHFALRALSL